MKKTISIVLILLMLFTITSCGKDNNAPADEENSYIDVNQVKEVENIDSDFEVISVSSISEKCKFVFHLDVPENFAIDRMEQIYVKEKGSETYDLLHDYLFHFTDREEMEFTIRCSEKESPIKTYALALEEQNLSSILGTDVVISQFENTYYASFSYGELYYDAEFTGIDEGAVKIILESICSYHG